MKKRSAITSFLLITCAAAAAAHDTVGHAKVMGRIGSIDEQKIVVETTDGERRAIGVDDQTACTDEEGLATCEVLKPGDRVVVKRRGHGGKEVADEIRFSSGAKRTSREPAGHAGSHSGEPPHDLGGAE